MKTGTQTSGTLFTLHRWWGDFTIQNRRVSTSWTKGLVTLISGNSSARAAFVDSMSTSGQLLEKGAEAEVHYFRLYSLGCSDMWWEYEEFDAKLFYRQRRDM